MRSSSRATRSHSTEPEHLLFTTGDDFGHGTYGLGHDAARSASAKLHKALMEEYWKQKDKIKHEWKMKEQQALQRRIADAKRSPRQRMEEALIEREISIKKQVEQRKQDMKLQKELHDKEVAERNVQIHEFKKAFVAARKEAAWSRELARKYELEAIYAEKAELSEIIQHERTEAESVQRDRAVKVRQWQEVSKQRAKEEIQKRLEEAHETAVHVRQRQAKLEDKTKRTRKEIEDLKKDAVKGIRTHEKSEHYRPLQDLEAEHANVASTIRKEVKDALEELQRKEAARLSDKKAHAQELREAQAESKRLYEEERRHHQELMQRSVKLQREEARRMQEEEEARKRQEHQEYLATLREISARYEQEKADRKRLLASTSPNRTAKHSAGRAQKDTGG